MFESYLSPPRRLRRGMLPGAIAATAVWVGLIVFLSLDLQSAVQPPDELSGTASVTMLAPTSGGNSAPPPPAPETKSQPKQLTVRPMALPRTATPQVRLLPASVPLGTEAIPQVPLTKSAGDEIAASASLSTVAGTSSGSVSPVIHRVEPIYPAELEGRMEGVVITTLVIDMTTGKVVSVRIGHASHRLFAEAAEVAAKQWQFNPDFMTEGPEYPVTFIFKTKKK